MQPAPELTAEEPATVDIDGFAGDVAGLFGTQEEHGLRNVVGYAGALERDLDDAAVDGFLWERAAEEVGFEYEAGVDGVGGDSVGGEFFGEARREAVHAHFGGRIGEDAAATAAGVGGDGAPC